jgi:predicted sulfurtransferase
MDLIGRTLPPSLACHNCGAEIDPRKGIYVDTANGEVRPVCTEHTSESARGVEIERRSRPESDEKWDEWYVITSVPDT